MEVLPTENINWDGVLKQMRGNPRLVRILVEATLAELPRMLEALRSAIAGGDAAGLQLAAHTLKGAVRYYGETPVCQWTLCLEKMGNNRDLADADDTVAKLESSLPPLERSLRAYLSQLDA
jgi:HPt (histidine-containing phosphotransfer) domain-containing protein